MWSDLLQTRQVGFTCRIGWICLSSGKSFSLFCSDPFEWFLRASEAAMLPARKSRLQQRTNEGNVPARWRLNLV